MAAGHPRRGGRQRRPRRRRDRQFAGDRVPAQPGPHLLAARDLRRRRHQLVPGRPGDPGLADAPGALADGPGGRLIALTSGGTAELGTAGGTAWTRLSSPAALAATPAGKACGVAGLTAAVFGSGIPMLAANCSPPGIAGIFASRGGSWRAAGPAVPRSLAGEEINVVRLTAADGVVALLRAGIRRGHQPAGRLAGRQRPGLDPVGPAAHRDGPASRDVIRPGEGGRCDIGRGPRDDAGRAGIIVARAPRAARVDGRACPRAGRTVDALAAHAGTFSDWRLGPRGPGSGTGGSGSSRPGTAGWSLAQTITVTIPYGSSG